MMRSGLSTPAASPPGVPRSLVLPTPYRPKLPNSTASISELTEQVKLLQAENNLLGTIVDDSRAEIENLKASLAREREQSAEYGGKLQRFSQLEAVFKDEHESMKQERERLAKELDKRDAQIKTMHEQQSELEELVVELSEKLLQCGSMIGAGEQSHAPMASPPASPLYQPDPRLQPGGRAVHRSGAWIHHSSEPSPQRPQPPMPNDRAALPQPCTKAPTPFKARSGSTKSAPRFPSKSSIAERASKKGQVIARSGTSPHAPPQQEPFQGPPVQPHQVVQYEQMPVTLPCSLPQAFEAQVVHPAIHEDFRHQMSRIEFMYQSKLESLECEHHREREQYELHYEMKVEQLDEQYRLKAEEQEASHQLQQAALKEGLKRLMQRLKDGATEQVESHFKCLQKEGKEHMKVLSQLEKRCNMLEKVCKKLQADAKGRAAEMRDATTPENDQGGGNQGNSGQQQQLELGAGPSGAIEVEQLRVRVQELEGSLEASKTSEGNARRQLSTAVMRLTKATDGAAKYAEEVATLTAANASLHSEKLQVAQQLAAAESAIQALRSDTAQLQGFLLDAKACNMGMLMKQLEGTAQISKSEYPRHEDLAALPEPAADYIKGLWLVIAEAEAGEATLRQACAEATYLEGQARRLLGHAREEQVAAQRALTTQMRRMVALEQMRLGDLIEISGLMHRQCLEATLPENLRTLPHFNPQADEQAENIPIA